jgi:hypothetical protein
MPEGTREAFQAYLDISPTRPIRRRRQGHDRTMETTVSTKYEIRRQEKDAG